MISKILITTAIGAGFIAIFYFNWFWRLLIIPIVLVFLFDLYNQYRDKRRKQVA